MKYASETHCMKSIPQKYESKYDGAMPSFDLQPKYEGASPTKFEPKYEPNLSMENSNSQQLVGGGETRIGMVGGVAEAPPRNILLAPENNSISMTLMQ